MSWHELHAGETKGHPACNGLTWGVEPCWRRECSQPLVGCTPNLNTRRNKAEGESAGGCQQLAVRRGGKDGTEPFIVIGKVNVVFRLANFNGFRIGRPCLKHRFRPTQGSLQR